MFTCTRRSVFYSALFVCAAFGLSACGSKWPDWARVNQDPFALTAEDRGVAPAPPTIEEVKDLTDPVKNSQPLVLKPNGQMGSLGLNLRTYLDEGSLEGHEERLTRLENAIVALHRDVKVLAPTVQELEAMKSPKPESSFDQPVYDEESDFDLSVDEDQSGVENIPVSEQRASDAPVALNSLVQQQPAALPKAPPPSTQQKVVNKGAHKAASISGEPQVLSVRMGEHPDKMRIVFDVTKAKSAFNVDLDNSEKLLVVEFPEVGWALSSNGETFARQPVVKSYKVGETNSGKGRVFVFQLTQPTEILMKSTLTGVSGVGERIVIDLKR